MVQSIRRLQIATVRSIGITREKGKSSHPIKTLDPLNTQPTSRNHNIDCEMIKTKHNRKGESKGNHLAEDEYLVTALVPSETACLASSPGRMSRTLEDVSHELQLSKGKHTQSESRGSGWSTSCCRQRASKPQWRRARRYLRSRVRHHTTSQSSTKGRAYRSQRS